MPLNNCTAEIVVLRQVHSLVADHGYCDVFGPRGLLGSLALASAQPLHL